MKKALVIVMVLLVGVLAFAGGYSYKSNENNSNNSKEEPTKTERQYSADEKVAFVQDYYNEYVGSNTTPVSASIDKGTDKYRAVTGALIEANIDFDPILCGADDSKTGISVDVISDSKAKGDIVAEITYPSSSEPIEATVQTVVVDGKLRIDSIMCQTSEV